MASVTKLNSGARNGWRVRFYVDKRRRELYLAGASKRVADAVGRFCDELAHAKAANVPPAADASGWASNVEGKLRESLVAWGLAEPINPRLMTDEGRLLGAYTTAYIEGRTDTRPNTRRNYEQARRELVSYFGERRSLQSITKADADRWRRSLLVKLAVATVSCHVKKAKTMFAEAVRDRLLVESPFANLTGGCESNPERQRFIGPEVTAQVLAACPDADWRLIFSLARFGGLRCPSDVLGLRWSDVDWDAGRLRIDSTKTGLRFCPMFPELRAALGESFEAAPEGAEYCVSRYRGAKNLRTQFERILERAGVIPWPKLFVNLRSTRRTELQEVFPDHVVNKWLGHSGAVAEKHYLQVTDEHWSHATDFRSPTGTPIPAWQGPSGAINEWFENEKTLGNRGFPKGWRQRAIPRRGVEPTAKTQGKTQSADLVPPLVPPSVPINAEVEELLAIYAALGESAREELLSVARALGERKLTTHESYRTPREYK